MKVKEGHIGSSVVASCWGLCVRQSSNTWEQSPIVYCNYRSARVVFCHLLWIFCWFNRRGGSFEWRLWTWAPIASYQTVAWSHDPRVSCYVYLAMGSLSGGKGCLVPRWVLCWLKPSHTRLISPAICNYTQTPRIIKKVKLGYEVGYVRSLDSDGNTSWRHQVKQKGYRVPFTQLSERRSGYPFRVAVVFKDAPTPQMRRALNKPHLGSFSRPLYSQMDSGQENCASQ